MYCVVVPGVLCVSIIVCRKEDLALLISTIYLNLNCEVSKLIMTGMYNILFCVVNEVIDIH